MVAKDVREERLKNKLVAAIERLRQKKVENGDLRKLPLVRFNRYNICKEAGVSRTLVSGENCEYPTLRDWLREQIHASSTVLAELRVQVAELKNQVSELEDAADRAATYNAELIVRAQRASRGLLPQGGSAKKSTKAERAAALVVVGRDLT